MSALDVFRSRLAESAKAAAGAAMQLSSLDELAQNDEYVQSEGLRVSEKKKRPSSAESASGNSELPSVVEDLSGKFVDALSMVARTPRVEASRKPKCKSIEGARSSRSMEHHQPRAQTQKPQLIPSVAALYDQNKEKIVPKQSLIMDGGQKQALVHKSTERKGHSEGRGIGHATLDARKITSLATIPSSPSSPGQRTKNVLLINEHQAHILNELDYDSDTDSSDDEFSPRKSQNDIEMGRQGSDAIHEQLEKELGESLSRHNSLNGQTYDDKDKDVHRFMKMTALLEADQEVLIKSQITAPESTPPYADRINNHNGLWAQGKNRSTVGEETNNKLRAGLAWIQNVASPQLEAISKQLLTKVTEPDLRNKSNLNRPSRGPMIGPRHTVRKASEEEEIITSTSTAFLSAQDMAELEGMRKSTSKLHALLQACTGNPRFAFIGVTFVVALFAYFYSRHRSVDDVD
ncbi:hypothetical protein ACHAW5_009617 [Stephanodiscus triporus]|uniref:Uncharacterized protein n=1 Tax=Stephanodiscus triporus TaxID=2934178 RepID=A0ABD3NVQ2_9STRA